MTLDNYLQDLGEQDFQEQKQLEVRKNPKVEELCKIFVDQSRFTFYQNKDIYRHYSKLVKNLEYTSKDITDLSIFLHEIEPSWCRQYRMGIFLSVLINRSCEENFTLIFGNPKIEINNLGMYNTKNITIFGNVNDCAQKMKSGTMILKGNSKNYVGLEMTGGKIVIEGETEADIGSNMRGGEIHVTNSVKLQNQREIKVGFYMGGGKIFVEGNLAADVAYGMSGGEIIINGNLICLDSTLKNITGGKVIVNGNAKSIGHLLNGGEIHIKGDVEHICACDKGTMHVEGDIRRIEEFLGETKIYHKGKRIGHNTLSRLYYNKLRKYDLVRNIFE